jgi:hypothetical protein
MSDKAIFVCDEIGCEEDAALIGEAFFAVCAHETLVQRHQFGWVGMIKSHGDGEAADWAVDALAKIAPRLRYSYRFVVFEGGEAAYFIRASKAGVRIFTTMGAHVLAEHDAAVAEAAQLRAEVASLQATQRTMRARIEEMKQAQTLARTS